MIMTSSLMERMIPLNTSRGSDPVSCLDAAEHLLPLLLALLLRADHHQVENRY